MQYYYIVMSQKEMLQNQVLEEILRERANYYLSKGKPIDFWISISPDFLKNNEMKDIIRKSNFYSQQQQNILSESNLNKEFYSALISLDREFLNWIKLRLGYFENIQEIKQYKTNFNYVSDGIFGSFSLSLQLNSNSDSNLQTLPNNPLSSNSNFIHPDLLLNKYKKSLNLYYSFL